MLDGQNTATGEEAALEQAIALKPDGLILGSLPAERFTDLFKRAAAQGIKIVTWHSAAAPGPIAGSPEVFWNISSDPTPSEMPRANTPLLTAMGRRA